MFWSFGFARQCPSEGHPSACVDAVERPMDFVMVASLWWYARLGHSISMARHPMRPALQQIISSYYPSCSWDGWGVPDISECVRMLYVVCDGRSSVSTIAQCVVFFPILDCGVDRGITTKLLLWEVGDGTQMTLLVVFFKYQVSSSGVKTLGLTFTVYTW